MKKALLSLALFAMLSATAGHRTDRLVTEARKAGWTEDQISRLESVCGDYERAAEALLDFQTANGLTFNKPLQTPKSVSADVRDPAIQQIAKVAQEQHNRYEVLSRIVQKYDPHRTNMTARAARQTMQEKLDGARAKVVEYWTDYTNQVVKTAAYSNAMVVAQGVAQAATAKIQEEIADLQAKIVKYKEYQTKYPLLKGVFAAMITDAENRIKVLQTLTR